MRRRTTRTHHIDTPEGPPLGSTAHAGRPRPCKGSCRGCRRRCGPPLRDPAGGRRPRRSGRSRQRGTCASYPRSRLRRVFVSWSSSRADARTDGCAQTKPLRDHVEPQNEVRSSPTWELGVSVSLCSTLATAEASATNPPDSGGVRREVRRVKTLRGRAMRVRWRGACRARDQR